MKYAARINSFLPTDSRNVLEAIEQIGKVGVVTHRRDRRGHARGFELSGTL